jgi:predicted DNA binding CopG/RHH family protein
MRVEGIKETFFEVSQTCFILNKGLPYQKFVNKVVKLR